MASHIMELPRKILIGENNISDIGDFLVGLSKPKKISLV
ncbi:MAG: glycerol-1-phosphate dehydrogenase, partial [Nitrosotalea sp.]